MCAAERNNNNVTKASRTDELPPFCRLCGRELTACRNLNDEIRADPKKLDQIATILASKGHNNVALVGKAGTGKTALISALASEIVAGRYRALSGRRIVEINIDTLLSGIHTVSEKGTRIANLLKEAENAGIILFFDEGHRLYGDGDANSLANILKPFLTRDKLRVVIATTIDEYNLFVARDPAFRRRFEAVLHKEPDAEETCKILRHVVTKRYPELIINDEALKDLVTLGIRYIPERNNPDKSLALLDTLIAWGRNHNCVDVVSRDLVREVVAARLNVPASSLNSDIKTGLVGLFEELSGKFPGWENVCHKVAESLKKAQTRNLRSKGPLSATVMCGADSRLMLDVANAAVQKLGCIGNGAVYAIDVNRSDPSDPYTAYVRKNPHAAIIFHGINSATPPEVLSRLRDVLCNGILKDANNRSTSYRYAHAFLLCEGELQRTQTVGFGEHGADAFHCDAAMEAVIAAIGVKKEDVIAVGAPDKAKTTEIYEHIFAPLLAKSAKKCGCNAHISLSPSAESAVFKTFASHDAWTEMHDIIEQIVLAALSIGEVDDVIAEFEDGKFLISPDERKRGATRCDRSDIE